MAAPQQNSASDVSESYSSIAVTAVARRARTARMLPRMV
jgi:hypothetical protein